MFGASNYYRHTKKSLAGKVAFVTGATGIVGCDVAKELARRGAKLILHYNNHVRKACELELGLRMLGADVTMIQADYTQPGDMKELLQGVLSHTDHLDYLIHTAGICRSGDASEPITDTEQRRINRVNQLAPIEITLGLESIIKTGTVILFMGSPVEDAPIEGTLVYGESKKGLHHFAARYAESARRQGVRSIYYLPGVVRNSVSHIQFGQASSEEMLILGQKSLLEPAKVARNVVASVIQEPLVEVADAYEGSMLVRRDGYSLS
jgi:NAD(P)-dependent dehydrogenase (short-subunit alcohol dehydrogenase family)